jgi:type VI secretion system protein VasJ
MNETQSSEIQVPDKILELLSPISGESPAGQEATVNEDYFKLDMEIGKVSPDYKICIDLTSDILTQTSKDLRVAAWLCLAWYRTEGLSGLKDGILLLLELIKRFGSDLHPQKPAHRSKAVQFIATGRFVKLIEREDIDPTNAPLILEIDGMLQELAAAGEKQFPDNIPDLSDLKKVIAVHKETAEKLAKKPPAKEEAEAIEAEGEPKAAPPPKKPPAERRERPPAAEPTVGIKDFRVESERDAITAFKRGLKFFFQQDEDHAKKAAYVFGISRVLMWSQMVAPPHQDFVTSIAAPDAAIVSTLQQWLAEKNWEQLVPAIELNFLNEDSGFKYWLTAQHYVVLGLEHIGGDAHAAAEEVMFHLAKLVKRFPDLSQMKFANSTPFADKETVGWIEEQVTTQLSGGGGEMLLPPIIGEEYDEITEEYKKLSAELPQNFEKNVAEMQQAIAIETRRRGRFLRTLNLANYCLQAKKHELAKVHLTRLTEQIEAYHLAEWEPALCTGVWESAFLVNLKLMAHETDPEQQAGLEARQAELFSKIALYDGVLALELASRTKNKGE